MMIMSAEASTSTAHSSSNSISSEESRPQAGPLPVKRGEIGFREDLYKDHDVEEGRDSPEPLPARHPADRDAPPAATTPAETPAPVTSETSTSTSTPSPDDASSTNSLKKHKRLLWFLKPKMYLGVSLSTWIAFTIQLLIMSGTIGAWVVAALFISGKVRSSNSDSSNQGGSSSTIFVHVVFAIALLGQALFMERRIFVIRAQRYAYLHPGEILPTSRHHGFAMESSSIALSPWNRPPLPTYAAVLAQSGIGTGDVEDHIIAAPPPPAYGNTRGSTLLLAGFLRDSLRVQRPNSVSEQADTEMGQRTERPLSYASLDEEWEVIQDADRARRLEETLATLERPVPSHTRN